MGAASQIPPTERELYERHQQYKRDTQPFIAQLNQIYAYMPHPGFKIDVAGRFEPMPIDKKWQELIDKVIEMRDAFIKHNYPEYYRDGN